MTTTITPWYKRPTPWPLEFLFTKTHVEKQTIISKEEGFSLPMHHNGGHGYGIPAYFIFVTTPFGDMRIEVSEKVYNLLKIDEKIVVSYKRGRWSGALEGKIAR